MLVIKINVEIQAWEKNIKFLVGNLGKVYYDLKQTEKFLQ